MRKKLSIVLVIMILATTYLTPTDVFAKEWTSPTTEEIAKERACADVSGVAEESETNREPQEQSAEVENAPADIEDADSDILDKIIAYADEHDLDPSDVVVSGKEDPDAIEGSGVVATADTLRPIKEVLMEAYDNRVEYLDITDYGITGFELNSIRNDILRNVQYFYVSTIQIYEWYDPGHKMARLTYYHTVDEVERVKENTRQIVSCIPADLSDMEKALLVYDQFVLNCIYRGTEAENSREVSYKNLDGVLDTGIGVCADFAQAYQYILSWLDIPCEMIVNENHAWNILQIDGTWYHVDTTWNIYPFANNMGEGRHDYFLQSTSAFEASGHKNWWTPEGTVFEANDTTYDNYFWKDIDQVFTAYDGNLYCIIIDDETNTRSLGKWDGESTQPEIIADLEGSNSMTGLVEHNGRFLYNGQRHIYSINPDGTDKQTVYQHTKYGEQLTGLYRKKGNVYMCISSTGGVVSTLLTDDMVSGVNDESLDDAHFLKSSYVVGVGKTEKASVVTEPANAVSYMEYSSSDETIATISSKGVVKGLAPGTVTISATHRTNPALTATCTVDVVTIVTSMLFDYTLYAERGKQYNLNIRDIQPESATIDDISIKFRDQYSRPIPTELIHKGDGRLDFSELDEQITSVGVMATPLTGINSLGEFWVELGIGATSIQMMDTNLELDIGSTTTITASVLPTNASPDQLIWSVGDKSVATISHQGSDQYEITPKGVGTTTIRAASRYDRSVYSVCTVTIVKKIKRVTVNKAALSIEPGEQYTLAVTLNPADATNPILEWESDMPSVATIDQDGTITGLQNGTAKIIASATDGTGETASCLVTVEPAKVQKIQFESAIVTLEIGKTLTLNPEVIPSHAANKSLSWKSSKPSIATVSQEGAVAGKKAGTTIITAEALDESNVMATCTIKVVPVAVTGISLDRLNLRLRAGESATLKATVMPLDAGNRTVVWISNDTSIATVDSNGVVKAVSGGTATITVKTEDGGKKVTCAVSVIQFVSGIKLNANSKTLKNGQAYMLQATVSPESATNKAITWSSNNIKVVKVDENGKVTAVGKGRATITANAGDLGGAKDTCAITVTQPATGVKMNATAKTVGKGKTITLNATVSPANADNKTVTWKSSNKKIATVSSKGIIKGIKKGKATITATTKDGNRVAKCVVQVGGKSVKSVKLNEKSKTIKKGQSFTLKATVSPRNAAFRTAKYITWSSSNLKVATVSSKGKIKAVGRGKATITAKTKDGNKTAKCIVNVR